MSRKYGYYARECFVRFTTEDGFGNEHEHTHVVYVSGNKSGGVFDKVMNILKKDIEDFIIIKEISILS